MKESGSEHKLAEHLFRENAGKMTAVLSRIFGLNQIDRIMDVVQDTFEAALVKWKYKGIPDNPSAWLMQVAKNKAVNVFKREGRTSVYPPDEFRSVISASHDYQDGPDAEKETKYSQLRLLLACCHPGLSEKNQVILTLNILCGFGIKELTGALFMNESAVKKSLFRTRQKLRDMVKLPEYYPAIWKEERIESLRTILYLMFNEGYKTTRSNGIMDHGLCYEAIRLTKLLLDYDRSGNGQNEALLALMFFNLSRFAARISSDGMHISLEKQDRSKWNHIFISEGYFYLNKATEGTELSSYHLESIIASVHCSASSFRETDWKTIVKLYEKLEQINSSPMVTLNRIIAQSYLYDPQIALTALRQLNGHPVLQSQHLLYASEGDLLERTAQYTEAIKAYRKAIKMAEAEPDRRFLQAKIQALRDANPELR